MRQMVGSTDEFFTGLPYLIATLGENQGRHIRVNFFILNKKGQVTKD